jgi:cytoskeleton protein RodZ
MNDKNDKPDEDPRERRSPGEILRTAREERKLSQQEIAQSLRLGIDVIKALDQDDFDKLSAPIFVRGYIRSYSALVGVSADDVVGVYNEQVRVLVPSDSEEPQMNVPMREKKSFRFPWLMALLAIIAVISVLLWIYNTDRPSPSQEQEAPVAETGGTDAGPALSLPMERQSDAQDTQVVPQETPAPDVPAMDENNKTSAESATESSPASGSGEVTEQAQSAADTTQAMSPPAPATAPATEPAPVANIDTLDIHFPDKSWVQIVDANGTRLVYRMINKGENIKVSGKSPFRILLGNATGVRLEFNGQPYDFSAHMRGNVARFQLK